MTKLFPDMMADVLDLVGTQQPNIIKSLPGWPQFDSVRDAYHNIESAAKALDESVNSGDVPVVATATAHLIRSLLIFSVILGVDMRPVWTAVHRSAMNGTKIVSIRDLLGMQGSLFDHFEDKEDIPTGIPGGDTQDAQEDTKVDA